VDLLDVWRDRLTPRQALTLIDQLPSHSRYVAAVHEDEELIEHLADQLDDEGPSPPPPLTDWTPEVERLTAIIDRLGELIAVTAAANSKQGKVRPPKPSPRPVTAVDRARRRRRERKHAIVQQRLAAARAAGRPTMADVRADVTGLARVRRGRVV